MNGRGPRRQLRKGLCTVFTPFYVPQAIPVQTFNANAAIPNTEGRTEESTLWCGPFSLYMPNRYCATEK